MGFENFLFRAEVRVRAVGGRPLITLVNPTEEGPGESLPDGPIDDKVKLVAESCGWSACVVIATPSTSKTEYSVTEVRSKSPDSLHG